MLFEHISEWLIYLKLEAHPFLLSCSCLNAIQSLKLVGSKLKDTLKWRPLLSTLLLSKILKINMNRKNMCVGVYSGMFLNKLNKLNVCKTTDSENIWTRKERSNWTTSTLHTKERCGLYVLIDLMSGPGSSVGIATELRARWSGIESRCGRDFSPVQTSPGAHPASCRKGTGSFPGVKCGRGVLLTTHQLLVPRSRKSRAIPLPTLWATPGL